VQLWKIVHGISAEVLLLPAEMLRRATIKLKLCHLAMAPPLVPPLSALPYSPVLAIYRIFPTATSYGHCSIAIPQANSGHAARMKIAAEAFRVIQHEMAQMLWIGHFLTVKWADSAGIQIYTSFDARGPIRPHIE